MASDEKPGEKEAEESDEEQVEEIDEGPEDEAASADTVCNLTVKTIQNAALCDDDGIVESIIDDYCVLHTNGDGACGLHAAFGDVDTGRLTCPRAREEAVSALSACYARYKRGAVVCHNFRAVIAALWAELGRPMALRQRLDPATTEPGCSEASLFWSFLPEEIQTKIIAHVENEERQRLEQATYFVTLDKFCRAACTPSAEPILRKVAEKLGWLPDRHTDFRFLTEAQCDELCCLHPTCSDLLLPAYEERNGVTYVRGTRDSLWPGNLPGAHKYAVLFNPDPAFDRLRRAFILPTEGDRERVAHILFEMAEPIAPDAKVERLAAFLLDEQRAVVSTAAPATYLDDVWPAYLQAVATHGHRYYFSYDEILAIADAACANVIVLQRMGNVVQILDRSLGRGPCALVVIRNTGGSCVRGHFERLLAKAQVQDALRAREEAATTRRREAQLEAARLQTATVSAAAERQMKLDSARAQAAIEAARQLEREETLEAACAGICLARGSAHAQGGANREVNQRRIGSDVVSTASDVVPKRPRTAERDAEPPKEDSKSDRGKTVKPGKAGTGCVNLFEQLGQVSSWERAGEENGKRESESIASDAVLTRPLTAERDAEPPRVDVECDAGNAAKLGEAATGCVNLFDQLDPARSWERVAEEPEIDEAAQAEQEAVNLARCLRREVPGT